MKTLKQVIIIPVFVEDFLPEHMEENHIYISEKYKSVLHKCLCGCGETVSTPLTKGMWTLSKDAMGRITLSPSIGNYSQKCQSHYIIQKNKANFV
jgi:hypothetical protein